MGDDYICIINNLDGTFTVKYALGLATKQPPVEAGPSHRGSGWSLAIFLGKTPVQVTTFVVQVTPGDVSAAKVCLAPHVYTTAYPRGAELN